MTSIIYIKDPKRIKGGEKMIKINKEYEKAAHIILDTNYHFDDVHKRVATGYLNHEFADVLADEVYEEFWNGAFNKAINYRYVLSVPMRVKASILSECTFLKGFNKLLF